MSMVAVSVIASSRSQAAWASSLSERARAEALADGGIYLAIAAVLNSRSMPKWRFDATPYKTYIAVHEVTVSIQDERGKIDLNTASDMLLKGIFQTCGLSPDASAQMVSRIVDWRTPGILHRLNGAKAEQYRAAGYGYEPRGGPFQSVSELRLVLGMTPTLYGCVQPALTIYNGQIGINQDVAPMRALLALPGMTKDEAARLLQTRRGTLNDLAGYLNSDRSALAGSHASGHAFRMTARVVMKGGVVFEREAVVLVTGDRRHPYWILTWREM